MRESAQARTTNKSMKIRRLEVQGFKSFASRTVLTFGEGITGVVGPNGCGKSNIVDAIRWVMGEQSAKHLRGSGMQDVIFAGSESRGPSGFSEVTLTFMTEGALLPEQYQREEEISVTRRLFRDGTSEYRINQVKCRLRDVVELFMGTGIGKNAYSIIEQGRIGLIVTAKPEDRRVLIEDAAGISRYKAKRKTAERRIESTEQNLIRIRDITEELEKRLSSLDRQAKKAARYRKIKEELRALDLHGASHRFLELEAQRKLEAKSLETERDAANKDEAALATLEQNLERMTADHSAQDTAIREREAAHQAKSQELALTKQNIEHLAREEERLQQRQEETQKERENLKRELETLFENREQTESLGAKLRETSGEETNALTVKQDSLKSVSEAIALAEQELESRRQDTAKRQADHQEHRSRIENMGRLQEELEEQIGELNEERKGVQAKLNESKSKVKEIETSLEENRQLHLSLEDQQKAQADTLEQIESETAALEDQLEQGKDELINRRSRLASLLEIKKNYEGCQEGVRTIMRRRQEEPEQSQKLYGVVADFISAEARYEHAVEAVLGERLQYVVVENHSDCEESVNFLHKNQGGRSSFIPKEFREAHCLSPERGDWLSSDGSVGIFGQEEPTLVDQNQAPTLIDNTGDWPDMKAPGVLGKMAELVDARTGYETIADFLLKDIVVCEDLSTARRIWENNGHKKTLVTLRGEVLDPVGVLSGGATDNLAGGLLSQKREIRELSDLVRMLEAKVEATELRRNKASSRSKDVKKAIEQLGKERHQEELSIAHLESELKKLREDLQRDQDDLLKCDKKLTETTEKRDRCQNEISQSEDVVSRLTREIDELETYVREKSETLSGFRSEAEALNERVTELRIQAVATEEKQQHAESELTAIINRISDIESRTSKLGDVYDQARTGLLEIAQGVEDDGQRVKTLEAVLEEETVDLSTARADLLAANKTIKDTEAELKTVRKNVGHKKDRISALTVQLREHEIGQKTLQDQIAERYRLELKTVVHDFHQSPLQSDEHKGRTEELRRRIDGMGAVNLTAIEEFEEVNERYTFLSAQQQELENAIVALRNAITRIDETSRERYLEAFELINKKFQVVFPKLFKGGHAKLIMLDENDPLESGLDIVASPPGKKLQSVTLLSGGEKALTAVALIFAIFLIKPTPFCLLDEVDAPLDEANVGRYNDMVRDMASVSQFILITHNKRTMELPDRLYGVTMEEAGISKIVPVDIREGGDHLT